MKALPEHALTHAAAKANIPGFLAAAIALGGSLQSISGRFLARQVKGLRRSQREAGAYEEEEEEEERDADEEAGAQGAAQGPEGEPAAAAALLPEALTKSAALADQLAKLLLSYGHTPQGSHTHRQLLRLHRFLLRQEKFLHLLAKASSCTVGNACVRR